MDGSFMVSFISFLIVFYDIIINGVLVGQSDGLFFFWNNFFFGIYDVFVIDNNGCVFNIVSVIFISSINFWVGWI